MRGTKGTLALTLGLALAAPRAVPAHELSPSLLSLAERAPGLYSVTWRVPVGLYRLGRPEPIWPPGVERQGVEERVQEGDMHVERFRVRKSGGLVGSRLDVRGRGPALGEVLVRIASLDGRTVTGRIFPGQPGGYIVPGSPGRLAVAGSYLRLGVEHILTGLDHLLFVLALTLLAGSLTALFKTVTAFTAAHSLTLALAALGAVRVPPAPVEAVIALSIVFVAREVWLLARGRPGLGARRPWPMAFAFGLLHGLGFAGALARVGLPETDVPVALLTFNLGVEIGQLLFIVVLLAAIRLLEKVRTHPPLPGKLLAAYAIGILATFWLFERVAVF
jgi:hydrogenase/urease accessory protein HupE